MILVRATSPTAGRSGGYPVAAGLPATPYIALPIITIGFLGWMSVLYLTVRRRSIAIARSSAGYFALVAAYVISTSDDPACRGAASPASPPHEASAAPAVAISHARCWSAGVLKGRKGN
ncbi:hypothetical protein Pme01_10020 [Planosporangium mesophilum]|uniref:Uncharacterized protein n=1 Tax=Planosporangium mesophilum TaxID=689768 RepID=A0A8J3TH66_9ACTN|nr:hypothetical protein Pme01_10020 [Planosporangium mesophilum]